MVKKSRDSKVRFYEGKHTYRLGKKQLTSGTTFLKPFLQPFNAQEIARKLASFWINKQKKHGVRWFLKEWKEAAEHGTRLHYLMEQYILEQDNKPNELHNIDELCKEVRDYNKFEQGIKWLDSYLEAIKPLEPSFYPEDIVYNEEFGIAGQIDLLVTYFKDGKEYFDIVDFKTNKEIKQKGYKGQKAAPPINELEDCNYNKYMLQLSLYAYMYEKQTGATCGKLVLLHLKEDDYKAILNCLFLYENISANTGQNTTDKDFYLRNINSSNMKDVYKVIVKNQLNNLNILFKSINRILNVIPYDAVVEESEFDELFSILKGQPIEEFDALISAYDKIDPHEKEKLYQKWFDGSGIKTWWD